MLFDIGGRVPTDDSGTEPHWTRFTTLSGHPDLFDPLWSEVVRLVNVAIAANPHRPAIDSRQAGADALSSLSSWWHGEFPRRFPQWPNGSDRGLFGMALWNYLATLPDRWHFAGIADAHAYGQDAKQYWRV